MNWNINFKKKYTLDLLIKILEQQQLWQQNVQLSVNFLWTWVAYAFESEFFVVSTTLYKPIVVHCIHIHIHGCFQIAPQSSDARSDKLQNEIIKSETI